MKSFFTLAIHKENCMLNDGQEKKCEEYAREKKKKATLVLIISMTLVHHIGKSRLHLLFSVATSSSVSYCKAAS